jgi:glutamate synthase domain-containing protein 2
MTNELCGMLAAKGAYVPDISIAGGFSTEDHIFKVLAMGAPYTRAVCMGRAMMIPGMVGKNIEEWIKTKKIPKSIAPFGKTKEEIFVCYEELKAKYGKDMDQIPLGAIGVYSVTEKLRIGLQQLMAGARKFRVDKITRDDLAALTQEAAKISGIPYVMDAYREDAMKVMAG